MNEDISIREVMNRQYVGVSESDDLLETVELLLAEDTDTAIVLRGSEPVGVVTERDVMELLIEGPDPSEATVRDAMTASVQTVSPDESLAAAADRLSTHPVRRLVVTAGRDPVGIITERDLLATRTYRSGEDAIEAETADQGTATEMVMTNARTEHEDSFQEQGICEVCGTLTGDLTSFNGQLLCADCRNM